MLNVGAVEVGPGITLFGGLRVTLGDEDLTPVLPGRQGRALLACLALNWPNGVSRDDLLAVLWPEDAPAAPEAAFSSVLAKLRRALWPQAIVGRELLALRLPDGAALDARDAGERLASAERALTAGDNHAALDAATTVVATLSAPLLAGLQGDWLEGWRRHYDELLIRALEAQSRAGLAIGGHQLAGAEHAAALLVERERFRESAYALLMEAQASRGDVAEALQTFERLRVLLREELGTAPSPSVVALHDHLLLKGAPAPRPAAAEATAVALPPWPRAPGRGCSSAARMASRRCAGSGSSAAPARRPSCSFRDRRASGRRGWPSASRTRSTPTAPRSSTAAPTRSRWRHTSPSSRPCSTCSGTVERPSPATSSANERCSPDCCPISVRRPIPRRPRRQSTTRRSATGSSRPSAALLARAAGRWPLLLVLDDLHWADRPTLMLLRHLLRHPDLSRLLVLGTFRPVAGDSPLAELLTALRRDRRYESVALAGLDLEATAALVSDRAGVRATPGFIRRLHEQTEGNAFFIEETLRALVDPDDEVDGRLQRRRWSVPACPKASPA